MKAIVTGAAGQDGPYLISALERSGWEVIGTSRGAARQALDIRDGAAVDEFIRTYQPDAVFQLAATSATRHELLFDHHITIAGGALNILEAVYRHRPSCKVFLPGSGLQFRNDGAPIHESQPFEARDAYSVARIASVYAARYYRRLGVRAYVGYLFNHDSPRRSQHHLNSRIVEDVRAIAEGRKDAVELGDPNAQKEFGYAPEIAAGMLRLVSQEDVFEAVIGTGVAYPVQAWVEACFREAGLDFSPERIRTVPGFQSDYSALVSEPSTMRALGWTHTTGLQALAHAMYHSVEI